ncbi:unnamed protein product, partial [marine sediment metagenome]
PLCVPAVVAPSVRIIARASVVQGLVFLWIARQRRAARSGARNLHVTAAALFLSSGLCGLGAHLPGVFAAAWPGAAGAVLIMVAGVLRRVSGEATSDQTKRALAECTALPAFFAWYVPVVSGHAVVALVCSAVAFSASLGAAALSRDRRFLLAIGLAVCGAVVAGALLATGPEGAAWVVCTVASAVAGLLATWAGRRALPVVRGAAALAWLSLSAAAVTLSAATGDAGQVLYCVTAVGFCAVLLGGVAQGRDAFNLLVAGLAVGSVSAAEGRILQ